MLTSTLTPNSARALICCSVAVMGLSEVVGATGDNSDVSSGSAGVTEDVDLRGGMLGVVWSFLFFFVLSCGRADDGVVLVWDQVVCYVFVG